MRLARNASESDFDPLDTIGREFADALSELGLGRGIAAGGGKSASACHGAADPLEHIDRNSAERTLRRIFRIDDVSASGQRGRNFEGV